MLFLQPVNFDFQNMSANSSKLQTENPGTAIRLPFPLPVIQMKDGKKKCCKKYKKGKACKKCPKH